MRRGIVDRSVIVLGTTPGVFVVRTDGEGERTFAYLTASLAMRSYDMADRHRRTPFGAQGSAAAVLMARISWVDSVNGDLIHLSGITLQLMTPRSREVLVNRLQLLRAEGSRVSLDTNDRLSGWPSPQVAAEAIVGRSGCLRGALDAPIWRFTTSATSMTSGLVA